MEHIGGAPGKILGTVHTSLYNHKRGTQQGHFWHVQDPGAFHTYELRWEQDCMEWSVDGNRYFVFRRPEPTLRLGHFNPARWPFDEPFHIILNVALGGMLGGTIDDASLPAAMEVDYVRVEPTNGSSTCAHCLAPLAAPAGLVGGLFLCPLSVVILIAAACGHKRRLFGVAATVVATSVGLLVAVLARVWPRKNFCVEGPMSLSPASLTDGRLLGSYKYGAGASIALNAIAALVAGLVLARRDIDIALPTGSFKRR